MNENSTFEYPASRALNISIRAALLLAVFASAALPLFVFGGPADPAGAPASASVALDVKGLWSEDAAVRSRAEREFAAAGSDGVRVILDFIQRQPAVPHGLLRVLKDRLPQAEEHLITLFKDPERRNIAGEVLFKILGPESWKQAPRLVECTRDPAVNHYCGRALVNAMGPRAKGQIPLLAGALKDPDPTVRMYAAAALGQLGPAAKPVVPALVEALQDPAPPVRMSVCIALGKIGKKAKAAVPALDAALQDHDSEVRQSAAEALRKIRG